MKSMEKLDVLRAAGADPTLAEAIVKTQEESDYVTKEYLDGKLNDLLLKLVLAMLAVAGIALGIARALFG
jgi:hypothetical protein